MAAVVGAIAAESTLFIITMFKLNKLKRRTAYADYDF